MSEVTVAASTSFTVYVWSNLRWLTSKGMEVLSYTSAGHQGEIDIFKELLCCASLYTTVYSPRPVLEIVAGSWNENWQLDITPISMVSVREMLSLQDETS